MYLAGAANPLKSESQIALERAMPAGERIVTDCEVLQELLHRYTAINRRKAIAPTVQNPVTLSARDAVHVATMERHGVTKIMSFDADFDRWPGLTRLGQF